MPDRLAQTEDLPAVSDVLREVIQARGLTAYTLAKRANASVDPIQRFLNGERGLNLATLDRLCAAMNLVLSEPHVADANDVKAPNLPRNSSMNEFFTIATSAQADLDDTTRLLFKHAAVWMPPMSIPACGAVPQPGDPFWLLYLEGEQIRVLGGGPLALAPRVMGPVGYTVLWNNADRPGLRDDARALRYGGPANMTFVRLAPPHLFSLENAQPLTIPGAWNRGLNLATGAQGGALRSVLPI
jgi:transcriptional regulator with XRE-family HTH domain